MWNVYVHQSCPFFAFVDCHYETSVHEISPEGRILEWIVFSPQRLFWAEWTAALAWEVVTLWDNWNPSQVQIAFCFVWWPPFPRHNLSMFQTDLVTFTYWGQEWWLAVWLFINYWHVGTLPSKCTECTRICYRKTIHMMILQRKPLSVLYFAVKRPIRNFSGGRSMQDKIQIGLSLIYKDYFIQLL